MLLRPYLNGVSGKSKSDIITLDGGLNTCYDRTFIKDNQMPYMWNVSLRNAPTLETRSDRMSLGWYMQDLVPYAIGEIYYMLSVDKEILYTIENIGESSGGLKLVNIYKYRKRANSIEKIKIGSMTYGKGQFSMTYWNGKVENDGTGTGYTTEGEFVIASNGYVRCWFQGMQWDVDMEREFNQDNLYPGIYEMHKNRLFVGNFNILSFSNLGKPTDFNIDESDPVNTAGEIVITNARGNITAIKSFDDKLIIFCEHSRHILYGSSPNLETGDGFQLVDMEDDVGCISNKTICVCNRNLYWVANNFDVYRYNGASTYKISEPVGNDNYAQYGGIKGININRYGDICMGAANDLVYISMRMDNTAGTTADTSLVYDTNNRLWWAEDGAFSFITNWNRSNGAEDYLLGAKYNGDILILNQNQKNDFDTLYDPEKQEFIRDTIGYSFETKTWNLGQIKHKKTLTNVWFQADADAEVSVADYWGDHNVWDKNTTDMSTDYLPIGILKPIRMRHNIHEPYVRLHEGGERQRCIIPRMYLQKTNVFSIRVKGTGAARFYMMEKEWRIR